MASEVLVKLPDGSTRSLESGANGHDLALSIGKRLAKDALAVRINGTEADLTQELPNGALVEILTPQTMAGREVLRHSTAHVLAQAVLRLWPGAHFAIGPVIDDGFYYDFTLPGDARFSDDDLARIEATMREIIAEDQPFERAEHDVSEGRALFAEQPYKLEIIDAVTSGADEVDAPADSTTLSTYKNSESFTDLCRGPHVPSTSRLGHFKLMRVAVRTGEATRSDLNSSVSMAQPLNRKPRLKSTLKTSHKLSFEIIESSELNWTSSVSLTS